MSGVTFFLTIPLWGVESSTILLSRLVCGDETTLDLGDRFLTQDHQEALAERHSNQVASMMESRVGSDDS